MGHKEKKVTFYGYCPQRKNGKFFTVLQSKPFSVLFFGKFITVLLSKTRNCNCFTVFALLAKEQQKRF
jgi:hypothetical protein